MHAGLWEQLRGFDKEQTARRANCRYFSDPDCYVITFLNKEYTVSLTDEQIFYANKDSENQGAGFLEQLCILAYLINASDVPLADKLVKGVTLPGGQFFFRGLHELPTSKLADAFGQRAELLYGAANKVGGRRLDFGDTSIEIKILPKISVVFIIWAGDKEFEARCSILFDRNVSEQLPLDALLTAVNLAVEALIKNIDEIS